MQTIYIYLSRAGWIWFAVAGTYLVIRLGWRAMHGRAIDGAQHLEADQRHEQ